MKRTITIFGASSSIAKEYIKKAKNEYSFKLFSRKYKQMKEWIEKNGLNAVCTPFEYKHFHTSHYTDVIINFVGAGHPHKVINYGEQILEINSFYDTKIMNYLKSNNDVHYLYLSSGSVYATDFANPVNSVSETPNSIDAYQHLNPYSTAKLSSELIHRKSQHLHIADIRIFNYLREQNIETERSFIGDIIKCIFSNKKFHTPQKEMFRDYINSELFFEGIQSILNHPENKAYDFYSKSPISKTTLLMHLHKNFEFNYQIDNNFVKELESTTGFKSHYYSLDRSLGKIGYFPKYSSLEIIDAGLRNYIPKMHS